MERTVALKKLSKLLGKRMGYRVDPEAPRQTEREEAQRKLRDLIPRREAVSKQMEDRRRAVLEADAEYQRLKTEHAIISKEYGRLQWRTSHYKFTVGTMGDLFFSVKAQGDSWEEVIAKLTKP